MGTRRQAAATLLLLKGFSQRIKNERDMANELEPIFKNLIDQSEFLRNFVKDEDTYERSLARLISYHVPQLQDIARRYGAKEAAKGYRDTVRDLRRLGKPVPLTSRPNVSQLEKDLEVMMKEAAVRVPERLRKHQDRLGNWRRSNKPLARGFARGLARSATGYAHQEGAYQANKLHGTGFHAWEAKDGPGGDGRNRRKHLSMHGEVRAVGEKFSNDCLYPRDPFGPADQTINCRCSTRPALPPR